MCQREDLIVLDVPDVVADGVVAPLVGPEGLSDLGDGPDLGMGFCLRLKLPPPLAYWSPRTKP